MAVRAFSCEPNNPEEENVDIFISPLEVKDITGCVFSYHVATPRDLAGVARVCSQWYNNSVTRKFWKNINETCKSSEFYDLRYKLCGAPVDIDENEGKDMSEKDIFYAKYAFCSDCIEKSEGRFQIPLPCQTFDSKKGQSAQSFEEWSKGFEETLFLYELQGGRFRPVAQEWDFGSWKGQTVVRLEYIHGYKLKQHDIADFEKKVFHGEWKDFERHAHHGSVGETMFSVYRPNFHNIQHLRVPNQKIYSAFKFTRDVYEDTGEKGDFGKWFEKSFGREVKSIQAWIEAQNKLIGVSQLEEKRAPDGYGGFRTLVEKDLTRLQTDLVPFLPPGVHLVFNEYDSTMGSLFRIEHIYSGAVYETDNY